MHRWKVEVEENTKGKKTKDQGLNSLFSSRLDLLKENPEKRYILCVFYRRESLFGKENYQLALCYWRFGQADAKFKQIF